MSEFNRLIPRTDEERIEDLESALHEATNEMARLNSERLKLHDIVADQRDLIVAMAKYILMESEE